MQLYLSLEVARNVTLRKSWLKDRYDIDSGNLYFTFKLSSDQTISNAFLLLFVFASRCGRSEKKVHCVFFPFTFYYVSLLLFIPGTSRGSQTELVIKRCAHKLLLTFYVW